MPHVRQSVPGFRLRSTRHVRVRGFHQGKPHEVRRHHGSRPEIRGTWAEKDGAEPLPLLLPSRHWRAQVRAAYPVSSREISLSHAKRSNRNRTAAGLAHNPGRIPGLRGAMRAEPVTRPPGRNVALPFHAGSANKGNQPKSTDLPAQQLLRHRSAGEQPEKDYSPADSKSRPTFSRPSPCPERRLLHPQANPASK